MDPIRKLVKNAINEMAVIFSGIDDKVEKIMEDIDNLSYLKDGILNLEDFKNIGKRHDIEFVDYDTFYRELPDNWKESDIPKAGMLFGLLNTNTGKARLVIPDGNQKVTDKLLDYIKLVLSHELVHVGQGDRMVSAGKGGLLKIYKPVKTVYDRTVYYSDKNENMAWAKTAVDQFVERNKYFILKNSGDMKLIFTTFYKSDGYFGGAKDALRGKRDDAWKKFLKNAYNYMHQKVEWLVERSKK